MFDMHNLLHFAMWMYIVCGIEALYAGYFFYKTVNGRLRKALINLFILMGVGILIRGSWGLCPVDIRIMLNPYVSLASIGFVFIGLTRFLAVIHSIGSNYTITKK